MSATPSPSELSRGSGESGGRWGLAVDIAFAATTVLLLWAMFVLQGLETVPYHLLFVCFAAVYGYRAWPLPITVGVLGSVIASTGGVLIWHWHDGDLPADELFEIGLMPLILGAMIWHARRRVVALRQVEQLAQQEREARVREHEFARDTSHALRTPLTIARGHVELLLEATTDHTVRADAAVALAELDRLDRMASRLLAIAQLERPDALSMKPVDLAALVRETHLRWAASVARAWTLECPQTLWACADEDVLRAALDAVIENAVKVTDIDDTLQVLCRLDDGWVVVAVEDSGPGIAEPDLPFVFQRFWRSTKRRDGSGLGLAYVRAAAEAHGGLGVAARSELGGAFVGARFPHEILLPVQVGPAFAADARGSVGADVDDVQMRAR